MSIIRSARPLSNFAIYSNEVIRDSRLSYRARGILLDLLSRPDNWSASADSICKKGKEGRDAVLTALNELREFGYLVTTKKQLENGKFSTTSIVYDAPQLGSPSPEKPSPEKPKEENQGSLEEPLRITIKNKDKEIVEQGSPEISEICYYLAKAIELRGLKPRPDEDWINGSRWQSEARLLLLGRIGEGDTLEASATLTVAQIKGAIDYAMNDPFWAKNILSPGSLRKKYPRLRMQAKTDHEKRQPKGLSAIQQIREEESRKEPKNALQG